jgi:hypothetical protein
MDCNPANKVIHRVQKDSLNERGILPFSYCQIMKYVENLKGKRFLCKEEVSSGSPEVGPCHKIVYFSFFPSKYLVS